MSPKLPKTALRDFLERSQYFRLHRLWSKRPSAQDVIDSRAHYSDPDVHYISDQRIERMLTIAITSMGVVMLVTPLWILAFVQEQTRRLGVITAFVMVFLGLLSFTTNAKTFESLAATAA